MDTFRIGYLNALIIDERRKENHAQFDVIRKKIEARLIKLPTPVELIQMHLSIRTGDRLAAEFERALETMAEQLPN